MGATPRLKQIAADLVAHFEARTEATAGKGMIVTIGREICAFCIMKLLLCAQIGMMMTRKRQIKIVMTVSASDKPLYNPLIYNKTN